MDIRGVTQLASFSFNSVERGEALAVWKEIKKYIIPQVVSEFFGEMAGPKTGLTKGIFDSTAINAAESLASFVNYGATSGGRRWVNLIAGDATLARDRPIRTWLATVEDVFYDHLSKSSFYQEFSVLSLFLVALGASALYIGPELKNGRLVDITFTALPLESLAWNEDNNGKVSHTYQKLRYTGQQIGKLYPERAAEFSTSLDANHEILRICLPSIELEESLRPGSYEYAMIMIVESRRVLLDVQGFNTKPIIISTWTDLPGNIYGRGIGHRVLADVKSLNALREMTFVATYKAIAPPYITTEKDFLNKRFIEPNEIIYVREMGGLQRLEDPIKYDVAQLGVLDLQNAVRAGFYADRLVASENNQPAFGMVERLLHPIVANINNKLLTDVVYRVLDILNTHRLLPARPPSLPNLPFRREVIRTEMVNAFSQRAQKTQSVLDWTNALASLASIGLPQALDNVDTDAVVDILAELYRIEPNVRMSMEAINEARRQRAEAGEQQRMADITNRLADAQSKLGGAQQ